jgi:Amt family ammonium transporter
MASRIDDLQEILDSIWMVVCVVMVILAQVGFMMREIGSLKMENNTIILLKTTMVISFSSLTFFVVGFGLSRNAKGGLFGQLNFIGLAYTYEDYTLFLYYLSLCVYMTQIATCALGE